MKNQCKECNTIVEFSLTDHYYVVLFGVCWECDKKHWDKNELSLADFEMRETKANEMAVRRGKLADFLRTVPKEMMKKKEDMLDGDEAILMCSRVEDYNMEDNELWEIDANKSYPRAGVACTFCDAPTVMSNGLYAAYLQKQVKPRISCGRCMLKLLPPK